MREENQIRGVKTSDHRLMLQSHLQDHHKRTAEKELRMHAQHSVHKGAVKVQVILLFVLL